MTTVAEIYKLDLPMWQINSACSGMDPELWVGDNHSVTRVSKAKAICSGCEVKDTCLSWVLKLEKIHGSFPGVYGGLTDRERREIKLCKYIHCNKTVKKINKKPHAQNNFCSTEHQELQAKHSANPNRSEPHTEYYMKGSIRNGKGSAGTY